ncbi:ImmA/IrrE family metallo-endopeptidase [Tautonia rosea]|uniref:ImmA/IrrE family metallo-endopeptidase n=1 Tax=Tautonia rosea TaxID=2728037 RepID=UPI001473CCAC|nr:ImmA/IrrE family metallo-endopeptidase [Tautonia rosea]
MPLPIAALRHPDVVGLLRDTGEADPTLAIRRKVEGVIEHLRCFGDPSPPLDLLVLVSLLGIRVSDRSPAHSEDAEIGPGEDGRLELRLNRERPEVRRRFSIGHEIGHTFFPGYDRSVKTRRPRKRDWSDPEDVVEYLCDRAASELLFPLPWFAEDVAGRPRTAESLIALADDYKASREAMLRRYAEVHEEAVAVVFLEWKLKPTQSNAWQGVSAGDMLLDIDPREEAEGRKRLRVDYGIVSDCFSARFARHIPADKSVDTASVAYLAARSGRGSDAEEWLDLGSVRGRFRVNAVPIPTPPGSRGPSGESMVSLVLTPLEQQKSPRRATHKPGWF